MEMRIIIIRTHNALLKPISRWSLLSAHFPPSLWCGRCSLLCLWTSWHGSRDASHSAWHSLGPRSSPEARVTKIILVPGMDRENVNTAGREGVLKSDFTAFLFLLRVMKWREKRKALHQRNHESCSQLPTSSSWQNICHDLCSNSTHTFSKKYYSLTNLTKDLEFQLPHSHPLPAMRGTLSFNCLICCWYKTPAPVMRPVMQSGFCKEEGSGGWPLGNRDMTHNTGFMASYMSFCLFNNDLEKWLG